MENATKPEISKNFNPSLPQPKDRTSADIVEQTKSATPGFLGRIKASFTPQIQESTVLQTPEPQLPEQIQAQTQDLYEKMLERVELQIDMHRQARKIISQRKITDTELQTEKSYITQSYLRQNTRVPDEALEAMARDRIIRRRTKDLLEKGDMATRPALTPEEIKDKLLKGEVAGVDEVFSTDETEESMGILEEDRRKLHDLETGIKELMQNPQVVSEYNAFHKNRFETLRKAVTVLRMKKRIQEIKIRHDQKARQVYLAGRQYSPGENARLAYEDQVVKAIEEATDTLLASPDVFDAYRLKYLAGLQEGFKKDRFAETPSRQKYMGEIRSHWIQGERVLLTGPTGGGKTELLSHTARDLFGTDPERLSGHPNLTSYEIYGKMQGKVVSADKPPIVAFEAGPYTRAVDRDTALAIDEINVVPNKTLMRMKADLNAQPGQEITIQEENGKKHRVGKGFVVGATANVKSEKHPDREEIDPAIVRMFKEIKIDYFLPHELYDIMLGNLMDVRSGVKLTLKDAMETLKSLCDATSWIQQSYNGDVVATDPVNGTTLTARGSAGINKPATLEVAVLDPGTAADMLKGWEDARRQDVTLREFLNPKIVNFIKSETFPGEDRYYLAEIFALQGFLKGVRVEELNIPGLDQATLDSWNGYDGKRRIPSKNAKKYLPPEIVAKLDPYGVLHRPLSSDIRDLLGQDTQDEVIEEYEGQILQPGVTLPRTTSLPASASGMKFSGLTIVPNEEGRSVLQTLDRLHPQMPETLEEAQDYINRIMETMRANPTTREVGVRKLDEVAGYCPTKFPLAASEEIYNFVSSINNFTIVSVSIDPVVARKIISAVQKLSMIKLRDRVFENNIKRITTNINNAMNEVIRRGVR